LPVFTILPILRNPKGLFNAKSLQKSFFSVPDSSIGVPIPDSANDPEKVKACGRHIQG
jgi:hypothetical protein